jgi:hypothetical protein
MRIFAQNFNLEKFRRAAFFAGILSSVLYAGMNAFIPLLWPAYDSLSQTVSELSAIGAPTRLVWLTFGTIYTILIIVFGLCASDCGKPRLRTAGLLIVAYGTIGVYWPPMHLREVLAAGGGSLTDTLHLLWAGVTVLIMLTVMIMGASVHRGVFRTYSFISIVVMAFFGALTGIQADRLELGLATPWLGVWERASVGAYLLWVAVFAAIQLRTHAFEAIRGAECRRS